MKYPDAAKAYDKAKITLMAMPDTLFYANILFSLKQTWLETIPTANTNGKALNLNPDWFLSLTATQRIGLLLHEILHVALQHSVRLKERNPSLFNQAADYVINDLLIQKQYDLPDQALYDTAYTDMSTEQVYNLLYQQEIDKGNNPDGDSYGIAGIGLDLDYADTKEVSAVQNEISNIILQAATQSKMHSEHAGNLPGEIAIELAKQINPKLPWNVILANFMQSFAKDDFSWSRPNRRYLPDYYLPSRYSEAIGNVCIAVDSSGSVTDEEFNYFITEIASLQYTMNPEKITLLDFDTTIKKVHEITGTTDIFKEVQFHGRGGTNITPVLEWANKHKPIVLLVFTDGQFRQPDIKVTCPLIWLIHGDYTFEPPQGKVIKYDIN